MRYIEIQQVYRDRLTNNIIRIQISINNIKSSITLDQLCNLKAKGYVLLNAVLTKDKVLRAKKGKLNTVYIDTKQKKNTKDNTEKIRPLYKYANRKLYDGNTEKFGVTINSIDYIVKYPKEHDDYSVFSEYVASTFMRKLGYNAHETLLYKDYDGRVAVLLKDFTNSTETLRSYKDTGQSSEDTNITNKSYTYKDIVDMIEKHTKLNAKHKNQALIQFWDMYMLDAVLANRDRHHGNWGYICSKNSYRIAPIYDNGSSLFPNVSDRIVGYTESRSKFLEERFEKFPASLLCIYDENLQRNKRTNYYEYVGYYRNFPEMEYAYNKIKNIGIDKVFQVMCKAVNNRYIPDIVKRFYIDIVCMRYMHIILRMSFEESYHKLNELIQKYGGK